MTLRAGYGWCAAVAFASLFFLYAPIAVLAAFSFNGGRLFHRWEEFSFSWYFKALGNEGFRDAALNTLIVSGSATVLATALATAAALGLQHASARQSRFAMLVLGLPLIVPEVVMAIATLIFLSNVRNVIGVDLGLGNLILAHTVFCIPFALMPVRACLQGIDRALTVAASDLYASRVQAMRHVLLPLLMPGIASGAALAFIVSFDDFAMSQFVAGPGQTTLPVFIWAQLKRPLTPEVNAMCTIMLVVSVAFVCLSMAVFGRGRSFTSRNL